MKLKVIITGSTGMVGKGVLLECIDSPEVEQILVINRSPIGITHPKLKEIIHKDLIGVVFVSSSMDTMLVSFAWVYHPWG